MKLYLLIVTSCTEDDREYMLPWYSDHYIFDSLEKRDDYKEKLITEDEDLSEDNFYEIEMEMK